jgi:transcriptional regulator with XRE-family HTH domain
MPLRSDRLRQLRHARGFTQEALAERLELGIRQIHRYERGLSDPAGDVVVRIARELNVTTDYLLGLSNDPAPGASTLDLTPTEELLLDAFRRQRYDQAMQVLLAEMHKSVSSDGASDSKGRRAKAASHKSNRRTPPDR